MISIVTPLAGRKDIWKQWSSSLNNLTWPHDQIKIILANTSPDPEFRHKISVWAKYSDFDVDYCEEIPESRVSIMHLLGKIYDDIVPCIDTEYLWLIDDDTLPPPNAVELLMSGFIKPEIFSVSGAYLTRYNPSVYCAWPTTVCTMLLGGEGIEEVGGNGFGCALMKYDPSFSFATDNTRGGLDEQFYRRQRQNLGRVAVIHWGVKCIHLFENNHHNPLVIA